MLIALFISFGAHALEQMGFASSTDDKSQLGNG